MLSVHKAIKTIQKIDPSPTRIKNRALGEMANNSIANNKNMRTCSFVSNLEANRTDVKTAAFNDKVPMYLPTYVRSTAWAMSICTYFGRPVLM